MSFFSSEYQVKLDAKGRLVLPAKIKAALPEGMTELMLRRGFEPCLLLYPMHEYKKIMARISGLSEFNEEYRKLQRNFFRGNAPVDLDSANRILIPKSMIGFAQLEKEVTVVGMGNRVEIWNPSLLNDDFTIQDSNEFSKLAEKFLDT